MCFVTKSWALLVKTPVGSPVVGSRIILPFSGSGVSLLTPARSRAFLFAHAAKLWRPTRKTGLPGATALNESCVG